MGGREKEKREGKGQKERRKQGREGASTGVSGGLIANRLNLITPQYVCRSTHMQSNTNMVENVS